MFRYALVKVPGLEQSPAADLDVVAAPKPPVTHNPFLRMGELPEMLQKLRGYKGKLQTQLGLRLLMLTGVRTGELRLATPAQFHLDQGLWIIPPEVVKQLQLEMRKDGKQSTDIPPYIVPLSVQAQEIVRYLLEQVKPAQKYLLTHRSDLKERISENTLNSALQRMGYANQLTGHGIRATISTALNEIGYPKVWVDAQLSHSDPDKVSSSYNHAEYVEQRRRMMQDWADRLDLWERGLSETASLHLTIQLDGMRSMQADQVPSSNSSSDPIRVVGPLVLTVQPPSSNLDYQAASFRLSALPPPPESAARVEPELSPMQREHAAMLAAYEAPHNLPVITFAKLAGKSRDQVNRDIKAKRLLSISLGNRGQRIPDWQLDPLRQRFTQAVLAHADANEWMIYRALSQPHEQFSGRLPIDSVTPGNLIQVSKILCAELKSSRYIQWRDVLAVASLPEDAKTELDVAK